MGVGYRIWYINKDVSVPEVVTYQMNEEVEIGDDFVIKKSDVDMSGYSVTVDGAEILSYKEFLEKYEYDEERDGQLYDKSDELFPEMIYNLHIVVKNTNDEEEMFNPSGVVKGLNFAYFRLCGNDFTLESSDILYKVANKDIENATRDFRLKANSEKEFYVPFYFQPSDKIYGISENTIKNSNVYLVVSLYPQKKQILLSENAV